MVPSLEGMEHPELGSPGCQCWDEHFFHYGATQTRPYPPIFWVRLHVTDFKVRSLDLQNTLLGWGEEFLKKCHAFSFHTINNSTPCISLLTLLAFNSAAVMTQRKEHNVFLPRRRWRKLRAHLSHSFLAFTQLCSLQVPFQSTGRLWTYSLVILAWKVTLSICGLCQWHLTWIRRDLGERGKEDSIITALKGKKWRSPRARLKMGSVCCEYCKQWWKNRYNFLPCTRVMPAAQGLNPLRAGEGEPWGTCCSYGRGSCQLCSILQQKCRKASLVPSSWWCNGGKVGRVSKMWDCDGLQPSQNKGKTAVIFRRHITGE